MEPLMYVMAILGCGESDAACQPVRVEQVRYASETECLAATEAALLRNDDLVFPNVVAQCMPAGQSVRMLRGSDVMRPEGGTLRDRRARYATASGVGPVRR